MERCTRLAMRPTPWLSTVAATVFIAVAGGALGDPPHAADNEAPSVSRQRELTKLLRDDCGSCHGMRLTGGLGPPLTPGALADKPATSLTATILSGRSGTAMPPWRPFMNESEAAWLVTRLQSGDTQVR